VYRIFVDDISLLQLSYTKTTNISPQYRTAKKNHTLFSASDIGANDEIRGIESFCVTVHHHFIVQSLLDQFVLSTLPAGGGLVNKVNRRRARLVPRWVTHKRHNCGCQPYFAHSAGHLPSRRSRSIAAADPLNVTLDDVAVRCLEVLACGC